MRQILIYEICNEKPNSAALGAYNESISTGGNYVDMKSNGDIKKALDKADIQYINNFSYKNGSNYYVIEGSKYRISDHSKPDGTFGSDTYIRGENDFRSYKEFSDAINKEYDLRDKTKLKETVRKKFEKTLIKFTTNDGEILYKGKSGIYDSKEQASENYWRQIKSKYSRRSK